ncbi:hypothetical protein AXFE_08330 [Acidithrix ferrooxidans]|uniref:Uncharacterized protein n=1 Tax=Acidithrix ferrooxidans TaxID=1280514 RepID=A0A0D8HK37_9ACTN|nr:hypothetical protein AXFE_08330 [Acidithrix ferrooxidans]
MWRPTESASKYPLNRYLPAIAKVSRIAKLKTQALTPRQILQNIIRQSTLAPINQDNFGSQASTFMWFFHPVLSGGSSRWLVDQLRSMLGAD